MATSPNANNATGPAASAKPTAKELQLKHRVEPLSHMLHDPALQNGLAREVTMLRMRTNGKTHTSLLFDVINAGHMEAFLETKAFHSLTFGHDERPFAEWVLDQVIFLGSFGTTSALAAACFAEEPASVRGLLALGPSPANWAKLHAIPGIKSIQAAVNTIRNPDKAREIVGLLSAFDVKIKSGRVGHSHDLGRLLAGLMDSPDSDNDSDDDDDDEGLAGMLGAVLSLGRGIQDTTTRLALSTLTECFIKMTPAERAEDIETDIGKNDGFAPAWLAHLLTSSENLDALKKVLNVQVGSLSMLDYLSAMKFRVPKHIGRQPLGMELKNPESGVDNRVVTTLVLASLADSDQPLKLLLKGTTKLHPTPKRLWADSERGNFNAKGFRMMKKIPDQLLTGELGTLLRPVIF